MRRRTALSVVSAAVGGTIVPLSFAPAPPAAAQEERSPQSPCARRDFDERTGTVTREAVSGTADPIGYVFNDARYKPDSGPVRRRGVRGRALYFDGYSTVVTAQAPWDSTPPAASPSTRGSPPARTSTASPASPRPWSTSTTRTRRPDSCSACAASGR